MKYFYNILLILLTILVVSFSPKGKYPIPETTNELLFYIQRNHNANTIIYDANFDEDGNLSVNKPIHVYWRRYDEQGQIMALRSIEKWYAYGVDYEKIEQKEMYKIKLIANKEREFWLKQLALNKAVLLTIIDNKLSELEHMYIYADNSNVWPIVKYIELFGYDAKTKEKTYEKIIIE